MNHIMVSFSGYCSSIFIDKVWRYKHKNWQLHGIWPIPVYIRIFSAKIYFFSLHCMKKRIFVMRKFVKRKEKIIFSLVFACSRLMEISYFLNSSSDENVRKQQLSGSAYFCLNMKCSHTIAGRKDNIYRIITKTRDFCQCLGQLFVDNI